LYGNHQFQTADINDNGINVGQTQSYADFTIKQLPYNHITGE